MNQAFKDAFRQAPPPIFAVEQPEKLKQCERLWWFDIVHAVFYRVGMFDGFDDYFDEVYEAFSTADAWEIYAEVPEVLQQLRSQGYELGVISNFDTRFFEIFRELGLERFFDSITISSLAGSAKPSPKIFRHALDQHVVEPKRPCMWVMIQRKTLREPPMPTYRGCSSTETGRVERYLHCRSW